MGNTWIGNLRGGKTTRGRGSWGRGVWVFNKNWNKTCCNAAVNCVLIKAKKKEKENHCDPVSAARLSFTPLKSDVHVGHQHLHLCRGSETDNRLPLNGPINQSVSLSSPTVLSIHQYGGVEHMSSFWQGKVISPFMEQPVAHTLGLDNTHTHTHVLGARATLVLYTLIIKSHL